VVGLLGCGRFDFDARATPAGDGAGPADGDLRGDAAGSAGLDGAGPDGAGSDGASGFVPTCPVRSTAPDPLTISGQVLNVLTNHPEANVEFEIAASAAEPVMITAIADGAGNFTFRIPTGGVPVRTRTKASKPGTLTSYSEANQPYDRDEFGVVVFEGSQADLDMAYAAAGLTEDPARGSVFLVVVDCATTPIAGATVTTSPASRAVYADTSHSPDRSLAATTSSGIVYLLDVPTGPLTITAAAVGLAFPPTPLTVHQNPDVSSTNVYASP
jgi:hypothetical protein